MMGKLDLDILQVLQREVRTRDTEALGELLRTRIGAIRAINSTRTTIVLETLKETSALPVPRANEERKHHGRA